MKKKIKFKPGDLVRVNDELRDLDIKGTYTVIPQDGLTGVVVSNEGNLYDIQWADGQLWMMSGDWIVGVKE